MTKKEEEKIQPIEKDNDEDVIYIGHKPPMSYVLAVVTQFNLNDTDEVILKARGRVISTAVDTAEIVRHRFIKNVNVKKIQIGTEIVTNEEGRNSNVSSIEICLSTSNEK